MAIHSSLRGLRCFCVAADCLSFKETARQLYLTPSAVSHQIKQLETELGFELFIRQTRAIELSNQGKAFYQALLPIMRDLEQTLRHFASQKPPTELSISMPEFFASEFFVPKLVGWSEQHPDINLTVETIKSRQDSPKYTDLQILLASAKPVDHVSYELFPISYIPACNPSLYQQLLPLGFDALQKAPLLVHQARPWAWHHWADQVGIEQFSPKQVIQLDSMFSVARASQQGLGIALIPWPISHSWFASGSLKRLFSEELQSRDKYYLVQHESETNKPEIQQLVEWILSSFRLHS
ncbi:LysR substrate-binding domain-containing protein [Rheinheimera sp.]|uniref:LysR substrate-binding domain-containing protein n=1 Tax=Rheinheimera sp. TaxID=1869214 RepID=UPI00307EE54F